MIPEMRLNLLSRLPFVVDGGQRENRGRSFSTLNDFRGLVLLGGPVFLLQPENKMSDGLEPADDNLFFVSPSVQIKLASHKAAPLGLNFFSWNV